MRIARSFTVKRGPYLCSFAIAILSGWSGIAASLSWQQENGYRVAELAVPAAGRTGFSQIDAPNAGINFANVLSPAQQEKNHNLINGSGLALGDVNGDGLCDIYLCGLQGSNRLYLNRGEWRFEDVTEAAGVGVAGQLARAAAFADVDGDCDLDLIVTFSGSGAQLLINDGKGRFHDSKPRSLFARTGATSVALGDIDNDGDLDLYVTNYGEHTTRSGAKVTYRVRGGKTIVTGRWRNRIRVIDGQQIEFGEPDRLYLNDGRGNFSPVSWTDGMFRMETGEPLKELLWDMGLSVSFRDINQDTHPDIYVCNDFQQPDRIWMNDGRGTFQAIDRPAIRKSSYFSMGADFADLNRDGLDEFMVVDMQSRFHPLRMTQIAPDTPPTRETLEPALDRPQIRRNTAYLNRGDGTYAEVALMAGLHATDWTWCPVFLDMDLDGFEDVLAVNGHAYDTQDLDSIAYNKRLPENSPQRKGLTQFPLLRTPNAAFRNRGDLTFQEVSHEWSFDSEEVSHGIALGDLDNDGDQDVVVNGFNTEPLLYRNESARPRIGVRLKGAGGNTMGIGARIEVGGGALPQSQEMICGGRYLASDDPMRTFAANGKEQTFTIEVTWRSGKRSLIEGALANHIYEIDEASADETPGPADSAPRPLFADLSSALGHTHRDGPFNEFGRQPSLTRGLNTLGPGIAWIDLNQDRWSDLIVGTGSGGAVASFINDGDGGFRSTANFKALPERYDITGLAAFGNRADGWAFLAGATNYESPLKEPSRLRMYRSDGSITEIALPDVSVSIGAVCVGDLDRDGDLDVFAGGRGGPGRFPGPSSSFILKNSDNEFSLDTNNSEVLRNIGMVSSAVMSDLNGDGWLDLVLVCDWGSPRLLINQQGQLIDRTIPMGLSDYTGFWNGVATGDFNGDGRLDLIASNWGRNTFYQAHRIQPIRISFGDLQGDGINESAESYFSEELNAWVPLRMRGKLSQAWPFVVERFPTHAAYSKASIESILGDYYSRMTHLEANTFESMLFLNQGDRFEARPLPMEAQLSPAFALCVADYDGDGHEDVFLSQNFFSTSLEIARMDAGRGLMLLGGGDGEFTPLGGQESGILVYGEQRGAAKSDFDGDGRVDLAVTQNRSATRLFKNERGKPGLRIVLKGPSGNPLAIGASLRLIANGRAGPRREIQAGSGYWSQNDIVQVMSAPETAQALWVRWPDGSESTSDIPAGSREVLVHPSGAVSGR